MAGLTGRADNVNDLLLNWLAGQPQKPGLLAGGVCLPDRTCASHSQSERFPLPALDSAWRALAEALHALDPQGQMAHRLRWSFQEAEIHFARRADGACLGLIVAADEPAPQAPALESLIQDFLELPFAA
jgi:hypothetical protein